MKWNTIAGIASTASLFLPVIITLAFRLFKNGSLLALFFSYLFSGIYSLVSINLLPASAQLANTLGIISNYLDTLLMLLTMLFFCNAAWERRVIYGTLVFFLLFEVAIAFMYGMQAQSSTYILGLGTFIILVYSIYFFVYYGKIAIIQGKSVAKTFMAVSLVFAYGCFTVIYFLHYIQKTSAVADVFLIYYIINFIAALLMSFGLVGVYKRKKRLLEIQTTRRELATFFEY
jgi:hypothetical protein